MGAQLVGIEAKIERAEKHLDDIRAEIRGHLHGDAETMFGYIDFDVEGRPHPTLDDRPFVFDPKVPCMIGDYITNLRAALDYLACGLVRVSGGEPCNNTYFPTMTKPNTPSKRSGHVLPDIQPGVPNKIRTMLDSVQPYTEMAGNEHSHPLAVLAHLARRDKHQQLLAGYIDLGGLTFAHPGRNVRLTPIIVDIHDDYAEVVWRNFAESPENDDYRSTTIEVLIEYAESPSRAARTTEKLKDVGAKVREIVNSIGPLIAAV